MFKGDYYKILALSPSATAVEIKAAYRQLATKHHPDRNPDGEQATKKMQEINEAYDVLSDPEKRACYDAYGSDWEFMFRWRKSDRHRKSKDVGIRGSDYQVHVKLGIKAAAKEQVRTFKVEGREVRVKIPAGVEADHYITFFGLGGIGKNGGPNGDLDVYIDIVPEPGWRLVQKDIYAIALIDLYTALLGGEIVVDTIDGEARIKIDADTPNGRIMRLRGKGFPSYKDAGPRGDFYVTLEVTLPRNLDAKEKRWVKKLAAYRTALSGQTKREEVV